MSNNTIITGTAGAAQSPRVELNILENTEAMTILQNTVSALRAIGVPCMLAPMSHPQGMSISLHVGGGIERAVAAYIAAEAGREYAGAAATHVEFMSKVAHALADIDAVDLMRTGR